MTASLNPFHEASLGIARGVTALPAPKTIICNYFSAFLAANTAQKTELISTLVEASKAGNKVIFTARGDVGESSVLMAELVLKRLHPEEPNALDYLSHNGRFVTPHAELDQFADIFIDTDNRPQDVPHALYVDNLDGIASHLASYLNASTIVRPAGLGCQP